MVAMLWIVLCSATAFAHPMGNFSVNHYSRISIGPESVKILYLIDMAEIPTYQDMRQYDFAAKPGDPGAARYLELQEPILRAGLLLESDGQPVVLESISRSLTFAEGAGGLPTMKIGFVFRAKTTGPATAHKLSYVDNNFPGRAGWKEIVVLGSDADILNSTAATTDRSQELTNYSSDALNSPPQQLAATIDYRINSIEAHSRTEPSTAETALPLSTPAAKTSASNLGGSLSSHRAQPSSHAVRPANFNRAPSSSIATLSIATQSTQPTLSAHNTPRSRFTDLISTQKKLSFWFLFSAALIAAGLGALHALEPGHGKTIVAAYLVGSRGTARHAVLLGVVVTAAHTSGVFLLGAITLYASRYVVPEQLYPWLGAISGLSVAGLGVFIFLRHLTGESGDHSHAPGENHSHWFLSMFNGKKETQGQAADFAPDSSTATRVPRNLSLRELCILGITGGIVPCPAALVVLLSAFSLHRIGFGLFLITAFSLGLALVLVIVGLTMVYTKRLMSTRVRAGSAAFRYLPLVSSAFMVILGAGITASAFGSMHFTRGLLSGAKLVPFVTVVLLGLFLGVRHSTDPDHVVAVSTIVSRQGSIRSSAAIGLLWGLGHTLTIFFVGSAIIIFGVVIPPRLGLSMEFSVALMLILLGLLNLTGLMHWITDHWMSDRLTPLKAAFSASVQPAPSNSRLSEDRPEKKSGILRARFQFLTDRTIGRLGIYQTIRPLAVGLVHGLAGSAAVALLVLSTIKSPLWSTAYLLVFGAGTMIGMMLMTAAISIPVVYTRKTFFNVNRHLAVVSGLASVAFGMFLVYQIGFVDGLFTAHVHWIPQ